VNDTLDDLGMCSLQWSIVNEGVSATDAGETRVQIGPDARVKAGALDRILISDNCREITLTLRNPAGRILARNLYRDPFNHPPRPEGYPHRMDHELGMRLYWA